ncbi:uncharacterized protein LOC121730827 [Aricia agestis]|uniref:uncharacterized protein LOC121730827 n=1 Tax=Aricia agestis TaxID=91739 RepID=UPI001C20C41B|nr:uncharacterized protein LOC121730827 [Aricia agestis]
MSVRKIIAEGVEDGEEESSEEMIDSDDDDETIARIQRAHYAQAAAMNPRRRSTTRPRPMSQKRKMEAVKSFHDFTKKLKKDTGIRIQSLMGNNILDLSDYSSEDNKTDSDGLSDEEFTVNPSAVQELNEENESYIDPETGDIVGGKKGEVPETEPTVKCEVPEEPEDEEAKVLTINDLINEDDLDLTKNVEISEVEKSELCSEENAEELLDIKQEENSQEFDVTEKLKEMGEISVKPLKTEGEDENAQSSKAAEEGDDEKKQSNTSALNVRRNIREVMDEKNLDASTLAAQRQESERLARVQEQQRIIREVQRQIAINRQNKIHQKTLSLLQGGSSILKKAGAGQKLNLPNTVLVKLPSGETKKTSMKQGQLEVTKVSKPQPSGSSPKTGKTDSKREVVEIVDVISSSGEESSSSSSDSDDCIMLSDSEVPPSPEADDDPSNSGLHVNDAYNVPDEQGRVLINIGHSEKEEDIFLAPQIARVIKPHQIGGVRFLFDNIIESVDRFSTSTGFGCILAHSMGLGKTLQIVCFCDIFLRHTNSKTVLCIMPINTLQNWVAEFNMWLPVDATNSPLAAHGEVRPRNFPIYVLNDSHKTLQMRAKVVKEWSSTGGVLMIGYELYRLLSMKKDKKPRKKKKPDAKAEAEKEEKKEKVEGDEISPTDPNLPKPVEDRKDLGDLLPKPEDIDKKEDAPTDEEKKLLDEMYEALVRPGPDLVICDEGHRIKNSHSNISYALKQMRTKRRIVLTGYPLQNNLLEYWCMVDFVRPNYLGSKTEFCNMFERPIQNGQCIDSTPQDIRLMRYRAHVLHSLLVGFVQRRSHAVLQSTLPQKEEYVLLVRMTPLQRQLYNRFMNEVVRAANVPNPLKAFAICCKIWNHPDVLYKFLKKRSEANAAIEEDLDLDEIRGVTKAGRPKSTRTPGKRGPKPKGKKPAATISPTTTGQAQPRVEQPFNSMGYNGPANGPYGSTPNTFRPDQAMAPYRYPPYQNSASDFFPPNQEFNQQYGNNYYQQQPNQFPNNAVSNYPNEYPQNPGQSYNQGYWDNGNYYGNSNYYNNPQYGNNQTPQDFGATPPSYNSSQQFPPNYNATGAQQFPSNALAPYTNNQDGYGNQSAPPYRGQFPNTPDYSQYSTPNNTPTTAFPSNQGQDYRNEPFQTPFTGTNAYEANPSTSYNQFGNQPPGYTNYTNDMPPQHPQSVPNHNPIKNEMTNFPSTIKPETNETNVNQFGHPYNYPQNAASYPANTGESTNTFGPQYPSCLPQLETKQPLGSAGSPLPTWPLTESLKTELDKIKAEDKIEMKSESDGEVKIEDLDTKKIVKDNLAKDASKDKSVTPTPETKQDDPLKAENASDLDDGKKGRRKAKSKEDKTKVDKSKPKPKPKPKGRKDRKTSKEKSNENSESEESDKEEKMTKEEELALTKKNEEMTYDWAMELLKDYIPGMIENSSKMELFFYILNESIKLGDRLLLFSQSLFTLNLIEDFLERNYIPGTNCLWERNVSYYRLDGSTHALEREKLINEFNANPHVHLFLVSTRAGSLGINLVGANRVIVFDASWNPCHDTQAVCRVYRYGQKKPCFVYRFVMDCCLEKKIYDRQINKQGMADRVVDECNPDAVLSMKEITNLCFDNDEKDLEPKDLTEHKDKYLDMLMQGIITLHSRLLSKEPFQHESLLVDRKEKKLSSAEKRLAQRGYELEKKAAATPKATPAYRTVRAADGSLVQRPVASVRPMQHGARWIPADVWRRQGMTAQEMTLPLDVVIPTNSAEKTNIVLKAGQRVMVLKSPKGIYMQLESGKIIAIKTSLKNLGQKALDAKDSPIGKKVLGNRPSTANIPGSLKNNSAITITSKSTPRPGFHRIIGRSPMGQKISRPMIPGQKIAEIRNRLGEMRAYSMRGKMNPGNRIMRPNLPGSLSITRVPKDGRKLDPSRAIKIEPEEEAQVLDSDDEAEEPKAEDDKKDDEKKKDDENKADDENKSDDEKKSDNKKDPAKVNDAGSSRADSTRSSTENQSDSSESGRNDDTEPIVLTTEEKLPSEETLENKSAPDRVTENKEMPTNLNLTKLGDDLPMNLVSRGDSKINLLKNYRHQRPGGRVPTESSLSQLEKTASALNKEGIPDFRKNLDDITQSYSPSAEEKTSSSSRKKRSPKKIENVESQDKKVNPNMSHSVSSMLNSKPALADPVANNLLTPSPQPHNHGSMPGLPMDNHSLDFSLGSTNRQTIAPSIHSGLMTGGTVSNKVPPVMQPQSTLPPAQAYPANPTPEAAYGQYPGYGMSYPYPSAPYYGGYGAPPYYGAGYAPGPAPPPAPFAPAPPSDRYLPPEQHW